MREWGLLPTISGREVAKRDGAELTVTLNLVLEARSSNTEESLSSFLEALDPLFEFCADRPHFSISPCLRDALETLYS